MLFLVLINYLAVWLMLAFCSLALIVFLIRRSGWVEMISLPALILTISIVFVIFSAQTSWLSKGVNYVQQSLRVNIFEVRPNWSSTWAVTRMAIKADPLTGVGPTLFWRAWDLYKPKGVNDSPYWNTDFNYGIGFIPSMVTTGGLLGLLGWLAFLLATIFVVAKSALVFWQKPDEKNSLLIFSSRGLFAVESDFSYSRFGKFSPPFYLSWLVDGRMEGDGDRFERMDNGQR